MTLDEIFNERYSVRKYEPRQVEEAALQAILAAGLKAPTGKNRQPQRIYVIQGEEAMKTLNSVCKCVFGAPTALLVCYNKEEACRIRFEPGHSVGEMDVSIVTAYMMLKAWELGIGSCWVRYFKADEVAEAFGLPENLVPACILDLGYAAPDCVPLETMHNRPRPLEETVIRL